MPKSLNLILARKQGAWLYFILSMKTHKTAQPWASHLSAWASVSASASVKQIILRCPGPHGGSGHAESLIPIHRVLIATSHFCPFYSQDKLFRHVSEENKIILNEFCTFSTKASINIFYFPMSSKNFHYTIISTWLAGPQAQIHRE